MLPSKPRAEDVQDWLARLLCGAVATWLAINIYAFLLTNYATARFWETWIEPGGSLALWVPVVAFALLTGIGIGVVMGLALPRNSALKVAAIFACLQLVIAIAAGGVAAAVVLAVGLFMGAMPSRVAR